MRSLFLLILLLPIFAFAELVTVRSGNYIEVMNLDKSNHVQARMYEKYEKNGQLWRGDVSKRLKMGLPAGAVTNTSVPVVLEHQVTKKAVLQNMFGKVSNFAKNPLVGRAGWVGLAASFAIPYIIDEFYLDEDAGAWVTVDNYYFLVVTSQYNASSIGPFSSPAKMEEFCQSKSTTCSVSMQFPASAGATDMRLEHCKNYSWKSSSGITYTGDSLNGNRCMNRLANVVGGPYVSVVRINQQREMSYDDFERLTLPVADADPSPWVNYSRPSQNEAPPSFAYVGVTAQSGATANTDPYTDPFDGKAKETKITINTDGKTVTLDHTLRPDLQGQTDVAPVPTPIPDNDKETNPETKPETNPASTPVQCDKYPDTLGCEKMGDGSEAESIFSDIKIPEITNPAEFKLDNFLPDNGSCPAPKTYSTSHGSIIYSYEKHCDVARTLRPFLIAFASVTALYLIFFRKA